jgi:hypothetical protein
VDETKNKSKERKKKKTRKRILLFGETGAGYVGEEKWLGLRQLLSSLNDEKFRFFSEIH